MFQRGKDLESLWNAQALQRDAPRYLGETNSQCHTAAGVLKVFEKQYG